MKRSIVLMLGLILAAFATASVDTKPDCRESLAKIDDSLTLPAQIQEDLLQGVWVQKTGESLETLLQFSDSGDAIFLDVIKMSAVYETGRYAWYLELENQDPILVLRDLDTHETYRLLVEQTCQGIDLTNTLTGHRQSYRYLPGSERLMQQQQRSLTGNWEHVLPKVTLSNPCVGGDDQSVTLENASLRFEFRPDGTFTRVLSSRHSGLRLEEEGTWEISKDGGRLFLHCRDADGNPITQCTRIKYLQMDELVLEQPLAVSGRRFVAQEDHDFYFNKN